MKCAEGCGQTFKPQQAKQLFCSRPCKDAYHNRMAQRGKTLAPLLLASRVNRKSDTAQRAYVEGYRLISDFNDEDKAAGRMSAHAFVAHGYRHGTRER